jgi:hypothetical protein
MAAWWQWWKRHCLLYGGAFALVVGLLSLIFWIFAPVHPDEQVLFALLWIIFGVIFLFRHRHQDEPEHVEIVLHAKRKT